MLFRSARGFLPIAFIAVQEGSCFIETAQRDVCLVFAYYSPVGNFTAANQQSIPPGLTISPQADTACPAADVEINRVGMDVKFFKFQTR